MSISVHTNRSTDAEHNLFEYLCIEVLCLAELSFTIVKLNSARQGISYDNLFLQFGCLAELSFTIVKLNSAIQGICMITYFFSLAVWLN